MYTREYLIIVNCHCQINPLRPCKRQSLELLAVAQNAGLLPRVSTRVHMIIAQQRSSHMLRCDNARLASSCRSRPCERPILMYSNVNQRPSLLVLGLPSSNQRPFRPVKPSKLRPLTAPLSFRQNTFGLDTTLPPCQDSDHCS